MGCDDPYVMFVDSKLEVYKQKAPFAGQELIIVLDVFPLWNQPDVVETVRAYARRTFLILEKAWQLQHRRLVDFKVEFGFNSEGNLYLADVIDNDSWRVLHDGAYMDKQVYRDGGSIDDVTEKYRQVRDATQQFRVPLQHIILWRDVASDDFTPFTDALKKFDLDGVTLLPR